MLEERKLNHAKFIDRSPLSRDSAFNIPAHGVRKVSQCFIRSLKHREKGSPIANGLEMPELPWLSVKEGIQRCREIGMLE